MRGEILPRARHLAILEDDLVCMSPVTESSVLLGYVFARLCFAWLLWLLFFGCFFRSPGSVSKQKFRNRKILLDFVTRLVQESVS